MFPMTLTIHDRAQLDAVLAALGVVAPKRADLAVVKTEAAPPATTAKTERAKPKQAANEPAPVAPAQSPEPAPAAAAPASAPAAPAAPAPTAPAVPYEEVKAAVFSLAGNKGRDAVTAVLSKFGLASAKDAKPEQYPEILAAVKAAS